MRFTGFGYLLKEGLKNVWSNRIMSIASVCVLVSCLVLTGSAWLFTDNVRMIVDKVESKNETTFYFKEKFPSTEAFFVSKDIKKIDNVEKVVFFSKEDGLKSLKKLTGEDIYNDLRGEENPLPDAVKVTMKDIKQYDKTVKKILSMKGVDRVNDHREFVNRLKSIEGIVRILSIFIVAALGIISLFIISNTIRATMFSRRFEISIMKSVGATNSFVRIPFIVEGMFIGLIAAILSTVGLGFLYVGVMNVIKEFIQVDYIPLGDVIWIVSAVFVGASLLIGALSGFISIRKYLKREGNELLGW